MLYEKQNFSPGQTLKASHMNHVEEGIDNLASEIENLVLTLREITEKGGNVGIASIEQTETAYGSGGINLFTVTLTDGTVVDFEVRNGQKGGTGDPGYTPVYGVDYATEEEKQEIISEVLEAVNNSGSSPWIDEITLLASAWTGSGNLHSQVVAIEGVTERSQVDLTPSVEQLVVFHEKDLTFVTENEDGVVTVYAIGQKPTNDYTIQVTIREVVV